MQKIWIGKAIASFQTPEFLKVKWYKYFYTKKFKSSKRLFNFKPQNFLDEAIQVLLHTKIWIVEAMKWYNYFYYYFYLKRLYESHISVGGMKGFTDLILP